jgi:hypothetical protein
MARLGQSELQLHQRRVPEIVRAGVYLGVAAKYLSFNTDQSTPHFRTRAKLFEGCTGGTIVFSDANDIAVDPVLDLGSKNNPGAELHDAYLMIY